MKTSTIAGTAGRIAGTIARGLIWANHQIDWAEVAAIVLQGLQVTIVLLLLAGRWTRRAWDALPALSEQLGRRYARLLMGRPKAVAAMPAPAAIHPLAELGHQLEALSCRELQALAGCRRKLAKRQLVALLVAA